jgi:hypothetical protein
MIGAQPAACLAALGSIALAPRVSYWVLFVAMLAARAVSRRRYFANQLAHGLALNVFWDRQRDRVKRPQLSDKAGRERQYRHEHQEQQADSRDAPGRISQSHQAVLSTAFRVPVIVTAARLSSEA